MNNRLIAAILILIMLFMLVGCNSSKKIQDAVETTIVTERTVPTEETEYQGVKNPFEDPEATWLDVDLNETVAVTKPNELELSEPKATEPKATEPKATEPKATEPKATEPKATEPKATEPKATEPKATEPKATEPKPTEPQVTEPQTTEPKPTVPAPSTEKTEYEKYMEMSGAEQKAYMESFGSIESFFNWLTSAKAEYEALHPDIVVGSDGKVEIG